MRSIEFCVDFYFCYEIFHLNVVFFLSYVGIFRTRKIILKKNNITSCARDIISRAWHNISSEQYIISCARDNISCAGHNFYINTCQNQELRLWMELIYQQFILCPNFDVVVWYIDTVYHFWNTFIEYWMMMKTLFDYKVFFSHDEIHRVIIYMYIFTFSNVFPCMTLTTKLTFNFAWIHLITWYCNVLSLQIILCLYQYLLEHEFA